VVEQLEQAGRCFNIFPKTASKLENSAGWLKDVADAVVAGEGCPSWAGITAKVLPEEEAHGWKMTKPVGHL
jgi:hypothetical protein